MGQPLKHGLGRGPLALVQSYILGCAMLDEDLCETKKAHHDPRRLPQGSVSHTDSDHTIFVTPIEKIKG